MQINRNALYGLMRTALLLLFPIITLAANGDTPPPVTGFGAVALNMMGPVTVFSDFVNSACIVIGGSFIFASIVKYFEYRRSPMMVPISTVVFLFIAGILLLLLPFLSYVTSNGIPFTLMG